MPAIGRPLDRGNLRANFLLYLLRREEAILFQVVNMDPEFPGIVVDVAGPGHVSRIRRDGNFEVRAIVRFRRIFPDRGIKKAL